MAAERYAWALLLVAASPVGAAAADAPTTPTPPAPVVVDADLLEFLGEFHDAKGEFVDPFVIDAVGTVVEQEERQAKSTAKTNATEPTVASPATQAPPAAQPEKKP